MPGTNLKTEPTRPLVVWQPGRADGTRDGAAEEIPRSDALLIDEDVFDQTPVCDRQALARATAKLMPGVGLFVADERHDGCAWYDALGRITRIGIKWLDGSGAWVERWSGDAPAERRGTERPARLEVAMRIEDAGHAERMELGLRLDVAVANPDDGWPANALLVAAGAECNPVETAEYLADACHVPRDPSFETDSMAHQRAEFVDRQVEALHRLLLPPDEAARRTIEHLAARYLQGAADEIPAESEVRVTLRAKTAPSAALVRRGEELKR